MGAAMHVGVIFPQIEIGSDPAGVRDFAQALEDLGYYHLTAFDHVLGANPASYPDIEFRYTCEDNYHEIFVLFGYLAALTKRLELCTGILVLPQRQTALVAKQAAAIDVLSGGRLRLGIGNGWNPVEFTALGANFHDRGKRIEEQLEVLRALWTQELVTFEGRWHHIRDAGINPLPVQRPIPVWFGGGLNEPVLRRIARLGDGWIPGFNSPTEPEFIERMRGYVREAGRDPSDLKIERLIEMREGTPESWAKQIGAYRDMGVDYVSAVTMYAGYTSADKQIKAIERFRDAAADFMD